MDTGIIAAVDLGLSRLTSIIGSQSSPFFGVRTSGDPERGDDSLDSTTPNHHLPADAMPLLSTRAGDGSVA